MSGLGREEQEGEIERSLAFLGTIGCDCDNWIMSYPYGDTNESLVAAVKARGCKAALTTAVGIADVNNDPFLLPRLDTNDLPKKADAAASSWTAIMQQGCRA
jgi:hypothetical protein